MLKYELVPSLVPFVPLGSGRVQTKFLQSELALLLILVSILILCNVDTHHVFLYTSLCNLHHSDPQYSIQRSRTYR